MYARVEANHKACGGLIKEGVTVKKFHLSLAALIVAVSATLLLSVLSGTSKAALPVDCDNNSIINCGAVTTDELKQKYNANATGDLANIYNSYGITSAMINNADTTAKMGQANKDGTITVDGQVVATGATSIGRQNIFSGSTTKNIAGKTYYDTPNSRAFASSSIVAYVFFDGNGQFIAAILTACGNPEHATPVPPKPKPVYACNSLTATTLSQENHEYQYTLSYTATGGATLKTVDFDFGDGKVKNGVAAADAKTVTHTYTAAGTYTTKAILHFTTDANGTVADVNCQATVTTSPDMCALNPSVPKNDSRCIPCDVPGKEQYPKDSPLCVTAPTTPTPPTTPPELPHTGPADMIGGVLGLGSIVAAGYYWYASKRGLLTALLNR